MAERGPEEKIETLIMTGAQEGPTGHRSGISIDSVEDVAVIVYDNLMDRKLYSSVGIINKESHTTEWGAPEYYDTGKQPSVALIHVDEDLYVLEVHRSQVLKTCCYRIGKVIREGKSINWRVLSVRRLSQCSGVKPKICASCNGTVAIVHEQSFSVNNLQYHIGKLDVENRTIEGLEACHTVSYLIGVEPDVAISDNKLVLVCRSDFSTLKTLVGVVTASSGVEVPHYLTGE